MTVSTIYQAIGNLDVQIHLNEIGKKIFFSGIPKNGIDQCDGTDDPTGERGFRKALGDDLAVGIDFNETPFSLGQMRKGVLNNSQLQVIATPRAPDRLQENLTVYLSKIYPRTFIGSSYSVADRCCGSQLTAMRKEGELYLVRFEIKSITTVDNRVQVVITRKLDNHEDVSSEELSLNLTSTEEKENLIKKCQQEISKDFIENIPWLKKRANPETQVETSFFHTRIFSTF